MKVGEVSKPIIKTNNVIFLKLTDKRNIKNNNLSKSELKEKLMRHKYSNPSRKYFQLANK